jgi:hypothetical protein
LDVGATRVRGRLATLLGHAELEKLLGHLVNTIPALERRPPVRIAVVTTLCRHQHFVTIHFSSGQETRLNQHLKLLISL